MTRVLVYVLVGIDRCTVTEIKTGSYSTLVTQGGMLRTVARMTTALLHGLIRVEQGC
jgi:hypothetical protein